MKKAGGMDRSFAAQIGVGRVPLTFSDGGNIVCHVPPLFSL